jgi:type IV pilus assembly protein PilB
MDGALKTVQKLPTMNEGALFGDWLVKSGLITHRKLCEALTEQKKSGGRLGEVLQRLNMLSDKEVTETLGQYLSIDCISLAEISIINIGIARMIPENIAKRFRLIAVDEEDGKVVVAIADPLNVVAIDTVTVKLKRQVKIAIATAQEIQRAIDAIYHGSDIQEQQLRDLVQLEVSTEDDLDEESLDTEVSGVADAEDAPVIRFVDLLLSHAIKSRASDIHIEPQEKSMIIRMRVDGVLCDMVPPARKMQPAVIARIKIISDMDIAERRLPQDGRFKVKAAKRDIDVRVSDLPTIYGEKIVMRILDKTAVKHELDEMGFDPDLLAQFKLILAQPHGIIIVTGPTGSGKSTTLYSALNFLRDPRKNITTVEDPVEYRLAGINQTQVKSGIGLTFASCLRAILRQDPDIILLGEIRDKETMEIAMKASLTGHLVLSTFHTNDAPSAISRLVYMGLEPYLLASSLNLILAQRLIRRVCEQCKEPVKLNEDLVRRLKITPEALKDTTFYEGKGCSECNGTGYKGRVPIFEFLPLDSAMREKVATGSGEVEIRAMARQKGYDDLFASGMNRLMSGLTTAEEILRVTFTEDVEV